MPSLVPRPPPSFVFAFAFSIIILSRMYGIVLNVNQFQSHMPRVGRWQIAQALVVNGMRLNEFLLCGMRMDLDWQIDLQV